MRALKNAKVDYATTIIGKDGNLGECKITQHVLSQSIYVYICVLLRCVYIFIQCGMIRNLTIILFNWLKLKHQ